MIKGHCHLAAFAKPQSQRTDSSRFDIPRMNSDLQAEETRWNETPAVTNSVAHSTTRWHCVPCAARPTKLLSKLAAVTHSIIQCVVGHGCVVQVGPTFPPLASAEGPLVFEEVVSKLDEGMAWLAGLYCNTMNVIHYMHDKYNYERIQVRSVCQPNAASV